MGKEENEIWLGLDISTNCIGMCLYLNDKTENGSIINLTQLSPKVDKNITGIQSLFEKKNIFKEKLKNEFNCIKIDKVIVEEPLLSSNNVNTVATLLRFNGMISDCVYEVLGVVPVFISSYDARYYSFPELLSIRKCGKNNVIYPKNKIIKAIKDNNLVLFGAYPFDIDKKVIMMDKINEIYTDIEWKKNKKGEIKKENFDACDSLIAILGYKNKLKYCNEKPTIISYNIDNEDFIEYKVKFGDKEYDKKIIFN